VGAGGQDSPQPLWHFFDEGAQLFYINGPGIEIDLCRAVGKPRWRGDGEYIRDGTAAQLFANGKFLDCRP
jgi:hypothetical protein